MDGLKKWFAGLGIRRKIVIALYAVLIPVQLILFVFIYNYNYSREINEKNREIDQMLATASAGIDEKLNSAKQIITYVMLDSDMERLLHRKDVEELNANTRFWYDISSLNFVRTMSFTDGYIKTIGIYPENGLIPFVYSSDHTSCSEDVRQSTLYEKSCANTRGFEIARMSRGSSEIYSYSADDKIVVCREVYGLNGKDRRFFAVAGMSASGLDDYINSLYSYENECIFVQDESGRIISMSEGCDPKLPEEISRKIETVNTSGPVEWRDSFVYSHPVGNTGLSLYRVIPRSEIRSFTQSIFVASLLWSLSVALAALPLLFLVSKMIINPLEELREAMVNFRGGDFTQHLDVRTNDQMGETQQGFNEMVSDMKDLIDKNYVITLREKESELNALQAQINPHFLYNTLDALYWKCVETDNEEIAEDVLALSDLFRLVLNTGKDMTFVSDEIRLLNSYLHMQQLRFANRFVYHIDVEDCLMDETLPKLLLQPFVENSVVHGFEKDTGDFTLDVIGRKEGDRMILQIIDTGVGMDEKQVADLFGTDKPAKGGGHRVSKYAIRNVKERLDLLYGDNYSLDISSRPGEGTAVRIEIPLVPKGGRNETSGS